MANVSLWISCHVGPQDGGRKYVSEYVMPGAGQQVIVRVKRANDWTVSADPLHAFKITVGGPQNSQTQVKAYITY